MKDGTTVSSQQRVLVFKLGANFTAGIMLLYIHRKTLWTPAIPVNKDLRFFRGLAQFETYVPITERLGLWSEGRGADVKRNTANHPQRFVWLRLFPTRPCPDPRRSFWNISEVIISVPSPRFLTGRFCMEFICALKFIYSKPLKELSAVRKGPRLDSAVPSFWMGGFHAWKELPIGPVSAGIEYYKSERSPLFFEVLLGYRLFQSSARR